MDGEKEPLSSRRRLIQSFLSSYLTQEDLSRLGREYSYMGRLQDFIFPAYDVRFIAINDDVFNDYYAKEYQQENPGSG